MIQSENIKACLNRLRDDATDLSNSLHMAMLETAPLDLHGVLSLLDSLRANDAALRAVLVLAGADAAMKEAK